MTGHIDWNYRFEALSCTAAEFKVDGGRVKGWM
jgi:hypothetical protein